MADALTIGLEYRGKRYNDASVGLAALSKELGTSLTRAAPALRKEIKNYLDTVALALNQRHGSPWPGGTGGQTMSVRSGALNRSIRDSVRVSGSTVNTLRGQIGSIFYGRIHEYGGVIKPKKAKYLTIPLPAALTSNGTPKKPTARDWDRTFVITSKKGNLLIVRKQGRGIVPLYVLKKSVRIPARLGMGDTLEKGAPQFVDKAMSAMAKTILSSAGAS